MLDDKKEEILKGDSRTCSGKGFVIFQKQRGAWKCTHDHRRLNIDNLLEKLIGQQSKHPLHSLEAIFLPVN